jgi:hypothetical protein
MKGVMVSINQTARFIDIAHHVPPHDISFAAFVLKTAYRSFPRDTVHLCVVDPGVGSPRKPLVVKTEKYYFVGPDNGVFTYIYGDGEFEAREITGSKYTLGVSSTTFDGRDVFAPAAAYLTLDVPIDEFGPVVGKPGMLAVPGPDYRKGTVRGHVMGVDSFGNLITDIERSKFEEVMNDRGLRTRIGDSTISGVLQSYFDGQPGKPICVWGSHGNLEVAVNQGRAVDLIEGTGKGSEVLVEGGK